MSNQDGLMWPLPHGAAPPAFDKEAYGQFQIPMKHGEVISGWDDPEMLPAEAASHMRDDDYVLGLVFGGSARAYPLWIIDHYHVVNDRVGDERFFVTSCERCQSGAAFVAEPPGNPERAPLFRSVGFINATLLLKDLRSGSHWIHYEGVGLDRRAAGMRLTPIPTYHIEWKDWVALHPQTEVMAPPDDPAHPDARHGHGREETFARPGMEAGLMATIVGGLDDSYPENEMTLGLSLPEGPAAYPLEQVRREGGVVHDTAAGRPLVVFAGPADDGFTMAAFFAEAGGRPLTFTRKDGRFVDEETGTVWTIEGAAEEGPLRGLVLEAVPSCYVRWHAWIYFHRDTRLFLSDAEVPSYPPGTALRGWEQFRDLLERLHGDGHDIRLGTRLVSQLRPRRSVASATVYVDGDRVNLHSFADVDDARDFDVLRGAFSNHPLRGLQKRTRRVGRLVVESDPEDRFQDPTNMAPIPASAVAWAKVLRCDCLTPSSDDEAAPRSGLAFADVIRNLRLWGLEVLDAGFLPPSQLRPGVEDGIALTIDAERFLLYRFTSDEGARAYASVERHAVSFGPFVLRSTPETMYLNQTWEISFAGDDTIRWSSLLYNPRLRKAVRQVVAQTTGRAEARTERGDTP